MNKNRILLRDRYFESAIMICIANIDGKDYFILEKRAKNIRQAGEISFPGGKKDKKDKDDKNKKEKGKNSKDSKKNNKKTSTKSGGKKKEKDWDRIVRTYGVGGNK